MSNKTYIGEGHYKSDDGREFMSIWTFKIKFGIRSNNTQQNYEDAVALSNVSKFRGPFSQSPNFKEGWMYEVEALKSFYEI